MYRVGIDVGGTFTDFVLVNEAGGRAHYYKVASTPEDPSIAIVDGLVEMLQINGLAASEVSFVGHGTTVATNMILERKGVTTGLLTTEGFRDVLEIGRQTRPSLYDYSKTKSVPLVRRSRRIGVRERLDAQGNELLALDEADVERAVEGFKSAGVRAVAISFLHSYRNGSHEARCKRIVERLMPDAYVSISSEVLPEFREYERTSTTVINAFVGPRLKSYMQRLCERVAAAGIGVDPLTFHSNGGLLSPASVEQLPVLTCLSGPAAGVVGSAALGAAVGDTEIITFDVGGTSTDVSLIADGKPRFTSNRLVDGHPIKMPMIDIHVVGAGGGSIASIDAGGALKVGPQSAGASPGPIAYQKGGTAPTLTDANLCLGRLNPEYLLGGRVRVDRQKAWDEIDRQIARPLGLSVEEASFGMLRIANSNMSRAIRAVSSEHGYDLTNFTLYAFGGAGPLHAADVAFECGLGRVLIPKEPGTMCARGILMSDVSRDFVQTHLQRLSPTSWPGVLVVADELRARGDNWLAAEGITEERRGFEITIDARYIGQTHDVPVRIPDIDRLGMDEFVTLFGEEHRKTFGYDIPKRAVEVVNIRLKVVGRVDKPLLSAEHAEGIAPRPISTRRVYFGAEHGWLDSAVYNRGDLAPGQRLAGPLIIEEMSGTTVVPPDWPVAVDAIGNLILGA